MCAHPSGVLLVSLEAGLLPRLRQPSFGTSTPVFPGPLIICVCTSRTSFAFSYAGIVRRKSAKGWELDVGCGNNPLRLFSVDSHDHMVPLERLDHWA